MDKAKISKVDENKIKEYFKEYELDAVRFTKNEVRTLGKTPDFKVNMNGILIFYCEVKSILGDDWDDGSRPDPTFNRLQSKIHAAVKQFDSVNPDHDSPNVLTLINYEFATDVRDLYSTLNGNFYSESGRRYPIYKQYSEGRIREEKFQIDLYIWIESKNKPIFLFNPYSPYKNFLHKIFQI